MVDTRERVTLHDKARAAYREAQRHLPAQTLRAQQQAMQHRTMFTSTVFRLLDIRVENEHVFPQESRELFFVPSVHIDGEQLRLCEAMPRQALEILCRDGKWRRFETLLELHTLLPMLKNTTTP